MPGAATYPVLGGMPFERDTRHLRIIDQGRAIAGWVRFALDVLERQQGLATGTCWPRRRRTCKRTSARSSRMT